MSKNNTIALKSYWDKRTNVTSRPSVSYRTVEVVSYIMEDLELPMGKAMEELMINGELYKETIEKLKKDYPDIK